MNTDRTTIGLADLERRLGKMTVASFLKSCRLSEGMTQAEFARKLRLSPANLCDIERGRKGVSPRKAAEIARRLGYSRRVMVELAINDALSADGLRFRARVEVA